MKKYFLSILMLILVSSFAGAQGLVSEKVESEVASLMNRFAEQNKATAFTKGWRIQILATTDRQRMENALRQFESLYPFVTADWVHTKPYYKIRAGAFTSKRDALQTLHILKKDYPTAYPVQDDQIKPEELLGRR